METRGGSRTGEQAPSESLETLQAMYEAERRRRIALETQVAELERAQEQLEAYAEDLRNTYSELRRHLAQMTVLHEISMTIGSVLDQDQVIAYTLDSLDRLFPYQRVDLYLVNGVDNQARRVATRGQDESSFPDVVAPGEGAVGQAIVTGRSVDHDNFLAVPLRAGGAVLGVLLVTHSQVYSGNDLRLIELVAGETAVAIQNARLFQETQRLATTDPLTGLYNFGFFQQALRTEVERAKRLDYPIGLIIADVDHFKRFNDRFGHDVGDRVLRDVARVIREQLRSTDVVARVGGEEFVALLPGCAPSGIKAVAEKVRLAVLTLPPAEAPGVPPMKVTISVGGASHFPYEADAARLAKQADEALYRAKRRGRNRSAV